MLLKELLTMTENSALLSLYTCAAIDIIRRRSAGDSKSVLPPLVGVGGRAACHNAERRVLPLGHGQFHGGATMLAGADGVMEDRNPPGIGASPSAGAGMPRIRQVTASQSLPVDSAMSAST